jgi:ATP-binding cassette subfamily E protein 1
MTKTLGTFRLSIEEGSFNNSEIIVLLGENGTGKTTFVRLLAGDKACEPDDKSYEVSLNLSSRSPNWLFPINHKTFLLNTKAPFRNSFTID